jgi:hypothetical protein
MLISILFVSTLITFGRIFKRIHLYWFIFTVGLGCIPYAININKGFGGAYEGKIDFANPLQKLLFSLRYLFTLLFGEPGAYPNSWVRIWPRYVPYAAGIFTIVFIILSVLLYGYSLNRKLFGLLAFSTGIYFIWTSFFYPGGPRHWFFLPFSWIVIASTFQIATDRMSVDKIRLNNLRNISRKSIIFMLSIQTMIQMPYSLNIVHTEIKKPFSSVNQLQLPRSNNQVLLIYPDYLGVTFLAEKDTNALFLQGNYFGAFHGFHNLRTVVLADLQKRCFNVHTHPVLLTSQVIAQKLEETGLGNIIQTSESAIVPEEGNVALIEIHNLCSHGDWSIFLKTIQE